MSQSTPTISKSARGCQGANKTIAVATAKQTTKVTRAADGLSRDVGTAFAVDVIWRCPVPTGRMRTRTDSTSATPAMQLVNGRANGCTRALMPTPIARHSKNRDVMRWGLDDGRSFIVVVVQRYFLMSERARLARIL
jgi:hypothetical protein